VFCDTNIPTQQPKPIIIPCPAHELHGKQLSVVNQKLWPKHKVDAKLTLPSGRHTKTAHFQTLLRTSSHSAKNRTRAERTLP
jgi:hypothetical protein